MNFTKNQRESLMNDTAAKSEQLADAPEPQPERPRKRRGLWWYTWRLMAVVVGWVILSFVWLVLEGLE